MSWVDELCAVLEPVDPGFATAIVPAAPSDVARLASMINRVIPEDYARYLAKMGAYDGGLLYVERCDARISSVLAYIERQQAAGRDLDPDRCIPMAIGADFGGFCLTTTDQPAHPAVALLEGLDPEEIVFRDLPAMAFAKAFLFELTATGRKIFVRRIANETAESLAEKLGAAGYQREWFSSRTRIYLRLGTSLAAIAADRPERPAMDLGGRDNAAVAKALATLRDTVRTFDHREFRQETLPGVREIHQRIGWV